MCLSIKKVHRLAHFELKRKENATDTHQQIKSSSINGQPYFISFRFNFLILRIIFYSHKAAHNSNAHYTHYNKSSMQITRSRIPGRITIKCVSVSSCIICINAFEISRKKNVNLHIAMRESKNDWKVQKAIRKWMEDFLLTRKTCMPTKFQKSIFAVTNSLDASTIRHFQSTLLVQYAIVAKQLSYK